MDEALNDGRFSHIFSDPRFRKLPKHVRKVALDKRMKRIFKDSSFKGKCELDKRGRRLNLTPTENLKKLYDVSSESSNEEEEDDDTNENQELHEDPFKQKANSELRKSSDKNTLDNSDDSDSECDNDTDNHDTLNNSDDSDNSESDNDTDNHENETQSKEKKKDFPTKDSGKRNETLKSKKKKKDLPNKDSDEMNETLKVKEKGTKDLLSEDSEENSSEESDDSDSESDASSGNQAEDIDHRWEELRNEAPDTDEITRRLAICNMDWDRIRAVDLLVCFNSFKPSDGCVNSIKIYPSEYGLKRMEEENLKGPPELVEETLALDEEEVEDKKGSKYHREKLRQYQISRLKYFYAVVDCDSPETANVLYEQLNGMEYESSSVRFDLRFIPDDVTFEHEPKDTAEKPPDPSEYKPRLFVTSALQQVKVDLTWDETDPKRRDFFQKIFTDPDSVQNDIQDYLASASSESEAEENMNDEELNENMKTKDRIAKYKELLLSIEEKERAEEENKYDIEVTWEPVEKQKVEVQIREKMKKDVLSPFEEMLQKKKMDKKLKKKEEKTMQKKSEDSVSEDSEEEFGNNASVSNEKTKDEKRLAELALISDSKGEMDFEEKPKKKNKKDKSRNLEDFVGDPNDPRFAAMYKSSLFNMIPSNPHEKKSENKFAKKSEKKRKFKSTKFNKSHKRTKY